MNEKFILNNQYLFKTKKKFYTYIIDDSLIYEIQKHHFKILNRIKKKKKLNIKKYFF